LWSAAHESREQSLGRDPGRIFKFEEHALHANLEIGFRVISQSSAQESEAARETPSHSS
jgi:hypothetical protein